MIVTEVFYGVKCSRCGELYHDGEHSFYSDEDSIMELAYGDEWVEHKGKHYCPECYDCNEDGDFVDIKPERPKSVDLVVKFIKATQKNNPRVIEQTDVFAIRYYENYGEILPCDIQWLKDRLGESLISVERQTVERYSSKEVSITLKNN